MPRTRDSSVCLELDTTGQASLELDLPPPPENNGARQPQAGSSSASSAPIPATSTTDGGVGEPDSHAAQDIETRAAVLLSPPYGPPPRNALGYVPYFVRVYLKRRLLTAELADRVQARQQAEANHRRALADLGRHLAETAEAERSGDRRWAALDRHLEVVIQARARLVRTREQSAQANSSQSADLVQAREAARLAEQAVSPARAQCHALREKRRAQRRKVEPLLRELARAMKSAPPEAAASPAHQADHAQRAQLEAHLDKISQAVEKAEASLAELERRHRQALGVLAAQEAQISRAQTRTAVSTGGARVGLDAALSSLAQQALQLGLPTAVALAAPLPPLERQRTACHTAESELRLALSAHDPRAYRHGRNLLLGGTGAAFFSLLLLIFL